MKKLLLLVLLTSMFGTAHATRSRMNSLGQDPNLGSFYLMDNRDFFRNPANAAKMRNFMVAELGTNYTTAEVATENVAVDGNLEGGYFGEFSSDMAFGVYLGKRMVLVDTMAASLNPSWTYLTSTGANPLNLFLAGGSDLKWGIDLQYAGTENEIGANKQKYNAFGLALGIETSGGLQVYASYQDVKSEGGNPSGAGGTWNNNEIKTSPFMVGVIYGLNPETTIWGQYAAGDTEFGSDKEKNSGFVVGVGRIYELSPTARFNFDLSYTNSTQDQPGPAKLEKTGLPLTIGLEADAAEWLILRASVKQNFILGDWTTTGPDGKESVSKSNPSLTGTKVALGGTLHFGKLKIDGNLGGFGGMSNTSLFNATNFFVNAAATYMF